MINRLVSVLLTLLAIALFSASIYAVGFLKN
jgi:hypothetical protein